MDKNNRSKLKLGVIEARKATPCRTLIDIGNEFGVTREYVRQILSAAGEHTRHYTPKPVCLNCGTEVVGRGSKYCKECFYKLHHVQVVCSGCGILFWKRISDLLKYKSSSGSFGYNSNHTFCSRECLGRWRGNTHGFGAGSHTKDRNKYLLGLLETMKVVHMDVERGANGKFSWGRVYEELGHNSIVVIKNVDDKIRVCLIGGAKAYKMKISTYIIYGDIYVHKKDGE